MHWPCIGANRILSDILNLAYICRSDGELKWRNKTRLGNGDLLPSIYNINLDAYIQSNGQSMKCNDVVKINVRNSQCNELRNYLFYCDIPKQGNRNVPGSVYLYKNINVYTLKYG